MRYSATVLQFKIQQVERSKQNFIFTYINIKVFLESF